MRVMSAIAYWLFTFVCGMIAGVSIFKTRLMHKVSKEYLLLARHYDALLQGIDEDRRLIELANQVENDKQRILSARLIKSHIDITSN
jgi:hypothetical protein